MKAKVIKNFVGSKGEGGFIEKGTIKEFSDERFKTLKGFGYVIAIKPDVKMKKEEVKKVKEEKPEKQTKTKEKKGKEETKEHKFDSKTKGDKGDKKTRGYKFQ